jgi:hypothetical protein
MGKFLRSLPHRQVKAPPFQYAKLIGDEIRLVTIVPAPSFDHNLNLRISHAPLEQPPERAEIRLARTEVQKTLPTPWLVFESLEGHYLFMKDETDTASRIHPDPAVDPAIWRRSPLPDYEPRYEALSYCWGDPKRQHTVYIESPSLEGEDLSGPAIFSLSIGHSLYEALKHLRRADEPRVVWADAVCINQADLEERSAQVKRMAAIYSLAHRVVVWAGLE